MSWIQSSFGSKISPLALFIIVVLAVVFFIAALLHLLIRFLLKQRFGQSDDYPEMSSSGAFQRQLQQLFHLHDSGLDQAYIDALPVFMYKNIMGLKEPFDCPVCLCEFSEQDKLRLLPICSHAFHIDCIDTWLLSNSTCPLCRGVILSSGISFENPVFYFEDGKETEDDVTPGFVGALNLKPTEDDVIVNSHSQSQSNRHSSLIVNEKRVFSVRLGKFKNTSGNGNVNEESGEVGESSRSRINRNSSSNSNSNSNLVDDRRCYSMGSFQYVVGDSELQVALCPGGSDVMVRPNPNPPPPGLVKGRGGGQLGNFTGVVDAAADADGKRINYGAKGESFSVSKIWLWSKKGKFPSSTPTHYPNSINVHLP